jgi:hypothetical protein
MQKANSPEAPKDGRRAGVCAPTQSVGASKTPQKVEFRLCAPTETVGASSRWLEKEDQRAMIICSLHASRLRDIGNRKLRRLEQLR